MTSPVPSHGAIDPARVPVHVAWVAAGSDRWAAAHRATPGELAAAQDRALLELVDAAMALGIRWLTVQDPTGGRPLLAAGPGALAGRGIELRVLGADGVSVPGVGGVGAAGSLQTPGTVTTGRRGDPPVALTITVTDGYSGRREIVGAVRALAAAGVAPDQVDERSIAANLSAPDMPDPDLLVQTGGDRRVPDLLLWEVTYSELVFLEEAWPEVRHDHVVGAVAEYQRRDRRYGGLVSSGGRR